VCVVPWGRDQSEAARRAEVCGAGRRLPRARLTPERLRAAVRSALALKPGAERVGRALREAGGAARAVALLEGLLRLEGRERTAPQLAVSATAGAHQ
jgi:UDP:flavonoid glycosyltransferase YjiC (YdhE family)